MTLKTNDFVSIEYTGMLKESGQVFDTTSEELAKKEKIHNPKIEYGPVTICIGQNQILAGIDAALVGKGEEKEFSIELEAEKAFGKKNAKLVRLIPSNIFKKQGIRPFIGLEVQIDGLPGVIRTVSGGRILVDFNHPLAGKDLKYDIKVNKKITDDSEKVKSYLKMTLGIKAPKVTVTGDKAEIEIELPAQITKTIGDKIKEVVPTLKTVEFISKSKTEKPLEKKALNKKE